MSILCKNAKILTATIYFLYIIQYKERNRPDETKREKCRMNNPYVTKKATRPKPWQGAILGICGFLTIVHRLRWFRIMSLQRGLLIMECSLRCCLAVLLRSCMVIREAWRCYNGETDRQLVCVLPRDQRYV